MSEVDSKIIKKTQELLGNYFKKPPLTEKLLSRPPFRFLHDIVTSIILNTGFMKGLFIEEELKSETIKDKEGKIKFLEKVIGITSLAMKKPIDVKPSSIVAGKEPEKTNELLQCLGKVISKKMDNSQLVKRYLSGETKSVDNKSSETTKDSTNKKRAKHQEEKNVPLDKDVSKAEFKSKKHNDNSKLESKKINKKESPEFNKVENKHENQNINKVEIDPIPSDLGKSNMENDSIDLKLDNEVDSSNKLQRPSSAKGSRHRHENDSQLSGDNKDNNTNLMREIARPPSARPAPPKVRKSSDVAISDNYSQSKVSNLIIEDDQDSDIDYVVEEYIGGGEIDNKFAGNDENINTEEHGMLVKKIIESKKDFQGEVSENFSKSDVDRKRDRHLIEKEMEKNRLNLQNITKYIHSLGKLIDIIQEDIDNMQKENDKWKNEKSELIKKFTSEKIITNKLLKPLNDKLEEQSVIKREYEEAISMLKIKLSENSKKIDHMLLQSSMCTF